jgi:tRNA nucleotidyltransferase (CCA-adding enzyme)
MSSPVRTIDTGATMAEAGELMARWGHGGLPIVEGGDLVGLVTRKDVDKASRHGLEHAPVTGFMGRDVVTVQPDLDLYGLERLLATRGIGRVPVVDGGELIGIITRKDVLRAEHGDAYLDRRLARAHPQAAKKFLGGIETLLPEHVRNALRHLGEIAAERGQRAHVVGGFVRDMLLSRRNLDLDIVVEGDGVAFAESAAQALGARVKVHRRFGTAVLVLSREFHVDIASSRSEYYTKPGALPTVERSTLRQDLFRRDFTVNAMAACIDPDCFGQLADPFGGLRDLEHGVVRVLHGLSFVDDPTRVLRAARFEERYGFRMDASTEELARRAVAMRMLAEVSGARIREELIDIFDEEHPQQVLARLHALGALEELAPMDADPSILPDALEATDGAVRHLGGMLSRPPRRRTALVAAFASSGPPLSCERWLRHHRFGREYSEVALAVSARSQTVLRALQDRRGMRDSRLYRLLEPLPIEAIAVFWARADELGRARIDRFASVLASIRPAVSGRDLIDMGLEPSEAFTAILARALDDRLDGRAVGREAELANLKRLALRIPSRS